MLLIPEKKIKIFYKNIIVIVKYAVVYLTDSSLADNPLIIKPS